MDKKQAQALIKETFESPFDKNRFIVFVKNLLNEVEEAPFIYRGNFIPDAYEQYVNTLERVGKYSDGEHKIDILIAKLKKETSIERARTMQRNFVAWYLNGSRGGELKDAALVAFVSPNQEDWRFSLVKMDYRFEETKKGRMRVKEEFTPARRWSFLVGVNENSHTAQSQLVDLIADDEKNPLLAQLEEAFNIEKVTKEFFEKYRELFLWTKETLDAVVKKNKKINIDFSDKGVNAADFSKKLLGQIVFLYFLQKKGWFGVKRDADWGTGPKNFLRELFEGKHGSYKNFFNDILEPLFYEALARERDGDFYSRFNCKIPFLNGGLFDPINDYDWVHTDILLPNDLFSNSYKTKEGDKGNGILDIFDRYNFTVKEDEPLEKEVAVDPEMLGKVFENLLEVKDRKSKGTYYTPREIVHYMCQESLINYLVSEVSSSVIASPKGARQSQIPTKGDIETLIKYGETAVEHDAMYIEKMLEDPEYKGKYKKPKLPKSIEKSAHLIDEKLAFIRICDPAVGSGAFPVGMMNEIVRARNALTSYIKDKNNRTIYDFKRHAIQNCLYGVDIDLSAVEIAKLRLWLSLIVDEEDIKQIKPLPNLDYKIVQGNSLLGVEKDLFNLDLFSKLEELKPLFFNETNIRKKQAYKGQIDKLITQITNGRREFDFEVYFSEVFHEKKGFDVVIANPPYGIIYEKNFKQQLVKHYSSFKRNNDIYIAFYERGLGLLRIGGILTYISPNTFLNGDYFKDFRKKLTSLAIIKEIFDFKELHIFDDPTVFVCTICCQCQQELNFPYEYKLKITGSSLEVVSHQSVVLSGATTDGLKIENSLYSKLISQTEVYVAADLFFIKDVGFNYWTKGRGKKRGDGSIGNRVFYSGESKNKKDIPFLKGRDISRYHIKRPTNFLVHDYQHFLKPQIDTLRFTPAFLERKPKIVYRQTANRIIAALDTSGYYLDKTVHLIVNKNGFPHVDLKYILGLLNSTFLNYLYVDIAQEREGRTFAQVKTTYLKKLPIKIGNSRMQKSLVALVDKILAITKCDDYLENPTKQAKVKEYERQIDQMVYKLYGLTEEEIKIVEERY